MGIVTVRTKGTGGTPPRRALLKAFGDRPGRHGHPAGTAQRRGDPSAPRVGGTELPAALAAIEDADPELRV